MADAFDNLGTLLSGFMGSSGTAIADQLEVAYDNGVIADIIKVLDEAQAALQQGEQIRETAAASYGSSPAGQALATNASLARQKVLEALGDMRAGLQGYQTVVADFHSQAQAADDTSSGDLTTLSSAISCVNQPTVGSPSQCTLPSAGGDS